MSTQIEQAVQLLFPEEGSRTLDIKFFCGGLANNITAESLADQVVRAEVQIRAGAARLVDNVDSHLAPRPIKV
jgi:hypothetical protein